MKKQYNYNVVLEEKSVITTTTYSLASVNILAKNRKEALKKAKNLSDAKRRAAFEGSWIDDTSEDHKCTVKGRFAYRNEKSRGK